MAKTKSRTGTRKIAKRPRTAPAARRTGTKPAVRRRAAVKKPKERRDPETLRLRSFMPSLTVNDLDKSVRFYTDVLGFIVGERWEEGGKLLGVMLKAGACEIGLSQDDWAKGHDRKKGEGIRLYCDTAQDIDALAARIKAAGGRLTQEPRDEMGGRHLSVDDPDGYHLSINKPN
jgi:catechol 2,3-dioxygenase-like lactoylglutathione lyase family enzyme